MRGLPTWVYVRLAVTVVSAIGLAFYLQQTMRMSLSAFEPGPLP
jgi:hypothetical protein